MYYSSHFPLLLAGAYFSFAADLVVSGSGTTGGILHGEVTFEALGPEGDFKISGTLGGGDAVAVLVPEAQQDELALLSDLNRWESAPISVGSTPHQGSRCPDTLRQG